MQKGKCISCGDDTKYNKVQHIPEWTLNYEIRAIWQCLKCGQLWYDYYELRTVKQEKLELKNGIH